MKPAESAKIIAFLKGAFPGMKLMQETVEVYSLMLGDLDFSEAFQAVRRHVQLNKWFPTVAEIRHSALKVAGTGAPLAGDAWYEALTAARRVGFGNGTPPAFSHPAVTRAVRATGWNEICHRPEGELGYVRKFFIECYEDFRDEEDGRAIAAPHVSPERSLPGGAAPLALPAEAGPTGEVVPQEEAQAFIAGLGKVVRGSREDLL